MRHYISLLQIYRLIENYIDASSCNVCNRKL